FFEQRGNSCSRPPTAEQYLNRHFYSSENTARDIDEIRKSLGLQKISVYGVSYGTIPAHLYSALFKDSTRAVVLEGVIFKSDDLTLIENPRRRKILQSFFNSLPANMQLRILEVSQQSGISPHWFSNVGQWMLYLDHPIKTYRNFLDNILWNDDSLGSLLSSFEEGPLQDPDFGFSQVMMNMLACQELGMNSANTGFYSVFSGSKLVAETNSSLREKHCAPLGFQSNEVATIFKASEHPLSVPVTYFQGTLDGATAAPQAVHSFKKAALGPAQLILVKKGGHTPLLGALSSGFESGPAIDLRKKVLSSALQGQDLSPSLLQELSSATELGWQRIQK
ncbi:MAG TPA: alpha/beta fold hydrolase, partial [Bdellovibrio sp.]|nr:alpha/beta fold hydrolase [Bdellovibrio sp.]